MCVSFTSGMGFARGVDDPEPAHERDQVESVMGWTESAAEYEYANEGRRRTSESFH
jgi:hypothetical protein